ncbi:hypothetical protein H5410_026184, partial [Solanum commersonii]
HPIARSSAIECAGLTRVDAKSSTKWEERDQRPVGEATINEKAKDGGLITRSGEFSRGACTFIPNIHRYSTFTSVAGWLETEGRLSRGYCAGVLCFLSLPLSGAPFLASKPLASGSVDFHVGSRVPVNISHPRSGDFSMVPCGSLLVPVNLAEFDSEMGHCVEWCLQEELRRREAYRERALGPPLLTPFHALFFGCAGTQSLASALYGEASPPYWRIGHRSPFEMRRIAGLAVLMGRAQAMTSAPRPVTAAGSCLPRRLAWAPALPDPRAVGLLSFPWRVEVRCSDGHTTTPHPATDAKVDRRVRRLEWSEDGGYDGPKGHSSLHPVEPRVAPTIW